MEIAAMLDIVKDFGFPVLCVIVLFRQNSEFQKTLQDLSNTLKEMVVRLESIEAKIYEDYQRK